MQQMVAVAVGGALGALARWGTSRLAALLGAGIFPVATITVNLTGSFLFGLVWSLLQSRPEVAPLAGALVLTGFMGAFTTFSTFAFETVALFERGATAMALINLLGQNVLGMMLVVLGLWLGRRIG